MAQTIQLVNCLTAAYYIELSQRENSTGQVQPEPALQPLSSESSTETLVNCQQYAALIGESFIDGKAFG